MIIKTNVPVSVKYSLQMKELRAFA